jgi:TonB family protein
MAFLGPSLRRKRVYDRPGVRVAIATLASILLNALVIWLLVSVGAFQLPQPGAAPKPISLSPLTSDQWDANRAIVGGAPPAAAVPKPTLPLMPKPPPPPEDERGQFVDVAPGKDQRKPKESRFLAEHDNTTEKETVSRAAGRRHDENPLQAPSDGAKRPPKELLGEGGNAAVAVPGKEGEKARRGTGAKKLVVPDQKPQEQLALAPDAAKPGAGEIPVPPRGDRQEISGQGRQLQLPGKAGEADGGQKRAGKIDPRLLPDLGSMSRIAGGPGLVRPDGVDEGDATSLNTRSFKYATFYQRMYRAIASEWNPMRPYDQRDPERRLFPTRERVTGVVIALKAGGELEGVRVVEQSGLDFLDEEAVRAVRAAAPFPNPPNGMVEPDGQVRVAFTFTLSFESSGRVNVVVPPRSTQRPYPE